MTVQVPLRIGIYSVSGIGKTTLLKSLSTANCVKCFDGSDVINAVCAGGLSAFKRLGSDGKLQARYEAIDFLQEQYNLLGKHIIVAGHYSFLAGSGYEIAWNKKDASFYDLIIYLKAEKNTIKQRCKSDSARFRNIDYDRVEDWSKFEIDQLEEICAAEDIEFYVLDADSNIRNIVEEILITISNVTINKFCDQIKDNFSSVILCDCDGTLNNQDALDVISKYCGEDLKGKVTDIFKENDGYTDSSFLNISSYIHSMEIDWDDLLSKVKKLEINRKIKEKINSIKKSYKNCATVFISNGFPILWDDKEVHVDFVIGGASFELFGSIITDKHKKILAKKLSDNGVIVYSFGNSSSDFGMLEYSHYPFFVYFNKVKGRYVERLSKIKHLQYFKADYHD